MSDDESKDLALNCVLMRRRHVVANTQRFRPAGLNRWTSGITWHCPTSVHDSKVRGLLVIPVQSGIQIATLDSRLRGNDGENGRMDNTVV
jgi:hypothetical protein